MKASERTEYLTKLRSKGDSAGTLKIAYKQSHVESMPVYRIDLDYLAYNQYNGRIGTLVKAHEKEFGPVDADDPDGRELIEKFLWDSQPERNQRTMNDLATVGQRDAGIVTLDGVIIDGNRRASLLIRNSRENNLSPVFFDAVILPDPMGADNAREIKRLETQYQMGLDEKLGYNALEKYLQIQDLVDNGFELGEIAQMMTSYDLPEIEKFWEVKQLMDEYLREWEYENMYTRLDRSEDWFWKLQESLKRFDLSRGAGGSDQVQWEYSESDVNDLKAIMFDYIRVSREANSEMLGSGQAYRDVCSAGKTGFFKHKDIWETFRDQHYEDFNDVEEKSIDEFREAHSGVPMTDVLKVRDKDFTNQQSDKVKRNFNHTRSQINTENDKNEPKVLLEAALSKLQAIDEQGTVFREMCKNDETITKILVEIGKKQFALKKVSEKNHPS